ncbi:2-dehydro-3-deoxygalactonokinase [Photobacterium alginatilyticum]|uniref:2-dehydro-3-deoxygalactonokinase n=1 Tax=Photobacterium alginatilyticum TaxID=1775171 RepID=UPI00406884CE
MNPSWIAVDWGTTNFRAFLMSDGGECLDKIDQAKGLLSVPQAQFPAVFDLLISRWNDCYGDLPVIMAGMVGSQQGWREVPYVQAPASAQDLANNTHSVELLSGHKAKIVSGVSCINQFGNPEVMRGEEIQLIGLNEIIKEDFQAILFGTHSKNAHWINGNIDSYSTVMTGELYSVLVNHSILGKSLPTQEFNKDAFIKGVDIGHQYPLNHVLFSARTFKLFNQVSEHYIHAYISGLLIGHEFFISNWLGKLYLVGSQKLASNYAIALDYLNIDFDVIDGDECFLKGITKIYNSGENDEY